MARQGRGARLCLGLMMGAGMFGRVDADQGGHQAHFERVGTFVVCENTSCDRAQVDETFSEIVAASADGRTLVYVDAALGALGFVDIGDPGRPAGLGVVDVEGQPTSVAVAGGLALAAVDTSASFTEPSGRLDVFDLARCAAAPASCTPEASLELGGQPDSVAVSPDGRFAAIVIENQRDEDVVVGGVEGGMPQLPGGRLDVIRLQGPPAAWTATPVDLGGLAEYAPEDPEPEYVAINSWNVAAVTLQENNHVAFVHLPTARVIHHFAAGRVTLDRVDTAEDDLIEPVGRLEDIPREPDAVAWLDAFRIATANEGDLVGGSRGFTVFGPGGRVFFDSGRELESLAQRHGHYPEGRSENKGTEPEGIISARFGGEELIFVGSERGNFVAVYEDRGLGRAPRFRQVLPTGVGPEGLLAIPQRQLFVAASENDEGPVRSQITIFRLQPGPASYPQVVSGLRRHGPLAGQAPIGWAALSALAGARERPGLLYSAHDSFLDQSRIYVLDASREPAVIRDEIALLKDGAPVDYDVEGLTQRAGGGFWVVSEGSGNAPAATAPNLLVEVAADGTVSREVRLPISVDALQRSNGFEGVAVLGRGTGERVLVAFQREWAGDPAGRVRLGEYRPATGEWRFFYYPLDPVASPAGGWVGLSELVPLSGERLLVLERDNVGGPDARIKRLYEVSLAGLTPQPQGGVFPLLQKTLRADLLPRLRSTRGWTQEKVEGVGRGADGRLYVVTDNDGLDENTGETVLLRLGRFPWSIATDVR